jgi:hypothetical protein
VGPSTDDFELPHAAASTIANAQRCIRVGYREVAIARNRDRGMVGFG